MPRNALAVTAVVFALLATACFCHAAPPIRFHNDRPGIVSLNIYGTDGTLVRQVLTGTRCSAGDHAIAWDKAGDGTLPPGNYTWRAVIHDPFTLRLRGWIGDWGGDRGTPSAAAADDTRVYLGWSLASATGDAVVACNPDGKVAWTHHRGVLSGCRALATDDGVVFVLGGEGADAEGCAVYKLRASDGAPIPWPDGRIDLKIPTLWPVGHKDNPARAEYFAVRNGRIYLSFAIGNFIAILDAKTGAYMQTIVGTPPGAIDAAGTKSDTPSEPNVLVDADFLVIAEKGASIGKLLLVHDPLWVVASELTPVAGDQDITALTMIGDNAKYHKHDVFAAFGPPSHQVQARSAVESEVVTYTAGEAGGRARTGAWRPDRMSFIRAIALDSTGQLWVAEGESTPKRISVWTTDASEGRFVREFFAPPDTGSPVAIHPRDPNLIFAGGCEWRIDPASGRASCLGVVTHEQIRAARFAMQDNHVLLILTSSDGSESTLERIGDGDYHRYEGANPASPSPALKLFPQSDGSWQIATSDDFILGKLFGHSGLKPASTLTPPAGGDWPHLSDAPGSPTIAQTSDNKVYITAGNSRVWELELAGAATICPLAEGKISVPSPTR